MVSRPEVLAIVQARGGSKGLPGKNVRSLQGHPLVAYSIASALAARTVTRVIVSTDDEEIAAVAVAYGAEAPFLRPAELAADDTPDYPLFTHALEWFAKHEDYRPTAIVQLRPTTPLRPRGMIDQAVNILFDHPRADCVRGVTTPKQTPYKMWRDGADGYLLPLVETEFAEPYNMPRQKLPPAYWQTGHIDAIRTSTITEQRSLTGKHVRPIMIDWSYCIDIDTLADFDHAARLVELRQLDIDLPRPVDVAVERTAVQARLPDNIEMIVFDFDGVFTDNRVLVFEDGHEAVLCHRGDGMGISLLRQSGIPLVVLSTEANPVVQARCRKLNLECHHNLPDKAASLTALVQARGICMDRVLYVGNDINDLGCLALAGFGVAVADAHESVLANADMVLSNRGGFGAVRELCDLILQHLARKS